VIVPEQAAGSIRLAAVLTTGIASLAGARAGR
jgi:hypothetical protein